MLKAMGKAAKQASYTLACAGTQVKNNALLKIAQKLDANRERILSANAKDMEAAANGNTPKVMLDRLKLDDKRIDSMIDGIHQVISLNDPIGKMVSMNTIPNGLSIAKVQVPLGVVGIIYESRPNVTVDAAALTLKAGNAVMLRGGSDAIFSNSVLSELMREALAETELSPDCINFVNDTSRESARELMQLSEYLDVLIPRGGAGLIRSVVENAKVPVIETGVGNCHIYVDEDSDLQMAADILFNAKCSRPSVCNAAESLLVAAPIAERFLPMAKSRLDACSVEFRGCPVTCSILGDGALPASDEDFYTEFLDYIISVKVVKDVDEAIEFINSHSSHHSEAIITNNYFNAKKFTDRVDSAAVYVNASTRFTDGGEFGLGAEIGISTQKMHARGPMGLDALTSTKFVVHGTGQVR